MKKLFVIFMLMNVAGFSKNSEDTLWSRNSIRVDLLGKTFGGIGVVFERMLIKKYPEKHPRAFTSVETGISDPFLLDFNIMPGLGISRNWYLFKHKKFIANAGIYSTVKINFDPTKKEIRDSYKGWSDVPLFIEYPFIPYLFGDLGFKMLFGQFFIKLSLNPVVYYEKIYARELSVLPWAGISFGFRLKK